MATYIFFLAIISFVVGASKMVMFRKYFVIKYHVYIIQNIVLDKNVRFLL